MSIPRVGITGCIGSGKTTVARMLAGYDVPVIDLDKTGHWALDQPAVKDRVEKAFGSGVLGHDLRVDREKLGQIVFNHPSRLSVLNSIVHPVILAKARRDMAGIDRRLAHVPYMIIDAALVFETGLQKELGFVVTVSCPVDRCIERVIERTKLSRQQVEKRFAAQLSQAEKIRRADYVIENSGGLKDLKEKVKQLHRLLCDKFAGARGAGHRSNSGPS